MKLKHHLFAISNKKSLNSIALFLCTIVAYLDNFGAISYFATIEIVFILLPRYRYEASTTI